MAALFYLNGDHPAPKAGATLIRAAEARQFFEADQLAEAWRAREAERDEARRIRDAEIEARAEEIYQKRRQEGYEEGLAAGHQEYTFKIMDTVMTAVDYLEGLENDLTRLITEAVRKIVGDLDSDELIVRLVRKALTAMRGERRVLVRVSPRDEKAVQSDLAAMLSRTPQNSGFLEVRADARLNPGECILESELGLVEASLETQLSNLSQALSRHIKS